MAVSACILNDRLKLDVFLQRKHRSYCVIDLVRCHLDDHKAQMTCEPKVIQELQSKDRICCTAIHHFPPYFIIPAEETVMWSSMQTMLWITGSWLWLLLKISNTWCLHAEPTLDVK